MPMPPVVAQQAAELGSPVTIATRSLSLMPTPLLAICGKHGSRPGRPSPESDIVGASALLTTTLLDHERVIDTVVNAGLRER
jgi:hypothetical protein